MSLTTLEDWQFQFQKGLLHWKSRAIRTLFKKIFDPISNQNSKILLPGEGLVDDAACASTYKIKNSYVYSWLSKTFNPDRPEKGDLLFKNSTCYGIFKFTLKVDLIWSPNLSFLLSSFFKSIDVQKSATLLHITSVFQGLFLARKFPFDSPPLGGNKETYRHLIPSTFKSSHLILGLNPVQLKAGRKSFTKMMNH